MSGVDPSLWHLMAQASCATRLRTLTTLRTLTALTSLISLRSGALCPPGAKAHSVGVDSMRRPPPLIARHIGLKRVPFLVLSSVQVVLSAGSGFEYELHGDCELRGD